MRRFIIFTILALCTISNVSANDTPAANAISRTFGVVEAYYQPEKAVELGASWDRVIFAWNFFQPRNRDEFITTSIPTKDLQDAQTANRQIVGLIKGTPAWASQSRSVGAVPRGIELPYDHPDNIYGAFVRRLVEHYSQRGIHHWIIMNEPDVRHGEGVVEFQGNVRDYYLMLKTAYLSIKAVDPDAHVQIGGMAWWADRVNRRIPYFSRLLDMISTDREAYDNNWFFDGVSVHIYFTTSSIWPIIRAHQEILLKYGLQRKEIWLDEFNASPRLDPLSPYDAPFKVTLEQQAEYVVQGSAIALAAGIDRIAVYRLFDNHFVPGKNEPWGLLRYDASPRPAFFAYQQVIQRFSGAEEITRETVQGATLITMKFPDHLLHVMWNDTFSPGEFLINVGTDPIPLDVQNAVGETVDYELMADSGSNLAVIDAPAAQKTDMSWVVVAGDVRIIRVNDLRARSIWYRVPNGMLQPLQ
jgi:hypothetical protein